MKQKKQQKAEQFYKKSIWPSIVLFLIFLGSCTVMPLTFANIFKEYLLDSQMAGISEDAEKLGQLFLPRIEEGDFSEAFSFLKMYLGEENDICATDADGRILWQFRETPPDFSRRERVRLIDEYEFMPDKDETGKKAQSALTMPPWQFLLRCIETLPKKYDKGRQWLKNTIFHEYYWVEIPVQDESYRLYYRDDVLLAQKHVYFLTVGVVMEAAFLTIPIILLLFNVLSSIAMQKKMVNLLYLDNDTGGKNWAHFQQRSKKILCQHRNLGITYAVVNLHMERYQDYCACYGSGEGEELLKKIYGYLNVNMESGETFARFANADFGILMRPDAGGQCENRLKKILAELTGIQKEQALSFLAGIYMIEPQEEKKMHEAHRRRMLDIDQAYHFASAARRTIQDEKGRHVQVYDQQILDEQLWKMKVEERMEEALLNQEFQLYLQPKYNPADGKMAGAEALVRWVSPSEGMIAPYRFIPVFEENGFITRLDDYMVSAVAKLQSSWKIQGKKQVPVSVNISRANFTRADLAGHICHLVDSYGADHGMIELELTESAFFGDKQRLRKILGELKMHGFRISMDDFGAGYSSLNSLKDLPIDVLKLDMDFFRGSGSGKRGEIVVRETIRLAKNLDMKVVAEGIEHKEQVEFLKQQGCDMIQGYYYAKPMPVSEFEQMAEHDF